MPGREERQDNRNCEGEDGDESSETRTLDND
jgi:hypothetical protein